MRGLSLHIALVVLALSGAISGCATYKNELERGISHYQGHRYEQSVVLFRSLEHDLDSLTPEDRARYAFYRGMADYRLSGAGDLEGSDSETTKIAKHNNARHDARYWLSIAKGFADRVKGSLSEEELKILEPTLTKLNCDVQDREDCKTPVANEKDDKKKDDKDDKKKDDKKSDDDSPKKKDKKKKSDDLFLRGGDK